MKQTPFSLLLPLALLFDTAHQRGRLRAYVSSDIADRQTADGQLNTEWKRDSARQRAREKHIWLGKMDNEAGAQNKQQNAEENDAV